MQNPWWIEYRREQYKPRQKLSMETILRKSFMQVAKEYANNCSVAGLKQMVNSDMGWTQRLFWTAMLTFLFGLVCYFLIYTWLTTLANPLILMPQYSSQSIASIDFPAIAVCNVNRISMKAVKHDAQLFYKNQTFGNISLNHLEEFQINLGRLLDFSYLERWGHPFSDLEQNAKQKRKMDTKQMKHRMKALAPDCKEILMRCAWAGEVVDCMSLFTMRRTARGHCCAFNYVLDFDESGHPNRNGQARRQTLPGYMHGLNVIIDPMLEDYAYPLNFIPGFDILIFEPTHYADPSAGRVLHRLAEPNRLEFLELKSIKQMASSEIRKYPLSTRKCIFQDENKADYHDLYSHSACIIRCRIKSVLSLCQCCPYFLPMATDEGATCLLSDLQCLNKYKDVEYRSTCQSCPYFLPMATENEATCLLSDLNKCKEKMLHVYPSDATPGDVELQDSLYCPDCYPDCEHTRHVTKSYKTTINLHSIDKYFVYGFTDGLNMSDKCVLSIYYAGPEGELELLDVVSYWYQIMSNIGGFSGVLIGFSVFSLIEIFYFWLLRYSQVVYKNYKDFY